MSDTLYPVPREPGVADGLSRLRPAKAEVTATGILRGRDQAVLTVAPPRLVRVPTAEVTATGIMRGREQTPLTVAPPRLILALAAELTATGIIQGRAQAPFTVAPSRLRITAAELTSLGPLRGRLQAVGAERLPALFGLVLAPSVGAQSGSAAITLDDLVALGIAEVVIEGVGLITLADLTLDSQQLKPVMTGRKILAWWYTPGGA